MDFLTWGNIKDSIKIKHGIETDTSYTEQELVDMYNRALTIVESEIIKLQQDYFLTRTTMNITKGTTTYSLPSDIYAFKIRRLVYNNSSYTRRRLYKARTIDEMETYQNNYNYSYDKKMRYMIFNTTAGSPELEFNYVDEDAEIIFYYTRNPVRFTVAGGNNQICEVPEFGEAIEAHMSYQIEWKDKSPTVGQTKEDFNQMMMYLTNSLAVAQNDEDMMIEPDTELYEDHV